MSDPNEPSAPPPDEPPASPFPESSLTPDPQQPPAPEAPAAPEPPAYAPPPAPEAPAPEAPAPAPPPSSGPPSSGPPGLWSGVQAPPQPPMAEQPPPPLAAGGLVGGDPLAGAAPAPDYPPGYTSPPPPGAGGTYAPPPAAPAPGTLVLSGWWRRVGAAIIDGLIITVIAFAIMTPLGIGFFSLDENDDSGAIALIGGFILGMLVIAVVALAYAPVMMGMTNGKTVGRMVTGIRVVRAGGEPITIGFAAIREVAVKTLLIQTVAGSVTFGIAGLLDVLWPLWDDENRALHDFVVNTRTVIDA